MNPFLEKKKYTKQLENKLKILTKEFEKKSNPLRKEIQDLYSTCNHEYANGSSAWESEEQDPGSGRSQHRCQICWAD